MLNCILSAKSVASSFSDGRLVTSCTTWQVFKQSLFSILEKWKFKEQRTSEVVLFPQSWLVSFSSLICILLLNKNKTTPFCTVQFTSFSDFKTGRHKSSVWITANLSRGHYSELSQAFSNVHSKLRVKLVWRSDNPSRTCLYWCWFSANRLF